MTNGFTFERCKQVIRRTFEMNKRTYALGFGGAFVGLYSIWLLVMLFGFSPEGSETSAMILGVGILVYHVAGYVLTATIFSELQSPDSASQLLTLPATSGEKLFSSWVITFVLYTFVSFFVLTVLLLLMFVTGDFFIGQSVNLADSAAATDPLQNTLSYMLFNSVFMLGAVYFRGNNFLKTAFSILLFFLFLGIQGIILINLFGSGTMQSFTIRPPIFLQNLEHAALWFQAIYTLPLTALFLVFSYFRLKNRQVV